MNKILITVPRRIIAVFFTAIIAVLFTVVLLNPDLITAALCFALSAGLIIFIIVHAEWRIRETVKMLTAEVDNLATDLSDKDYNDVSVDTRAFYNALKSTKLALDKKGRNRQELLDIVNAVASHNEIGKLLRNLLPRLNDATRSSCSAFYSINASTNKLEIKHSVGFSKNIYSEFDINLGEGLVGQAAAKNEITYYRDIPEDTVYFVRTFIGKLKPRSMMVVPVLSNDTPTGVLVCVSIYDYTQDDRDMIELIRYYVGVAVSNGANYERTLRLTGELQFQNKLIQDQHEQMKTRLDEKTAWLNAMLGYTGVNVACALDVRGIVVIWSDTAARVYGVSAKNAVGKYFDRICEDNGWPSAGKVLQEALLRGSADETCNRAPSNAPRQTVSLNLRCVYDAQREPLGVLISINEIGG
jgi:putative methionine-R-sulfoxide reductase with GAF domain